MLSHLTCQPMESHLRVSPSSCAGFTASPLCLPCHRPGSPLGKREVVWGAECNKHPRGTQYRPDVDESLVCTLGLAVNVEERMMDAVTGLSGSGPAYVFLFLEAMADGAVAAGLPREKAMVLAAQTVAGAARMVRPPPHRLDH